MDDTEISDDVIQSVLTLMEAQNTQPQQLSFGFYTPAEIVLITNQPGYIRTVNGSLPRTTTSILIHPLVGHWVTSYYNESTR